LLGGVEAGSLPAELDAELSEIDLVRLGDELADHRKVTVDK
jgi:hypothetical protein